MALRKILFLLFLIFSVLPVFEVYAQDSNTGFVKTNIWYSKDSFEEGDKIEIHTFVFNSNDKELSGTVIFFDKTVLLGKKNFSIPAKKAGDVYIDWMVTAGDHNIFGKIESARFLISKDKYEDIYIIENETEKSSKTISKKIVPESKKTDKSDDENKKDKKGKDDSDTIISSVVENVKDIIENKISDSITAPFSSGANALEGFRESAKITSENKKEELKSEIKVLKAPTETTSTKQKTEKKAEPPAEEKYFSKPFKQVELFFLSLASFILGNKIIFYGVLIIFVILFFRFLFKKVF